MKITRQQLRKIIKEELSFLLNEQKSPGPDDSPIISVSLDLSFDRKSKRALAQLEKFLGGNTDISQKIVNQLKESKNKKGYPFSWWYMRDVKSASVELSKEKNGLTVKITLTPLLEKFPFKGAKHESPRVGCEKDSKAHPSSAAGIMCRMTDVRPVGEAVKRILARELEPVTKGVKPDLSVKSVEIVA